MRCSHITKYSIEATILHRLRYAINRRPKGSYDHTPSTEDRRRATTIHYQQKMMDNNTAMQPTEEEFEEKQQDRRFFFYRNLPLHQRGKISKEFLYDEKMMRPHLEFCLQDNLMRHFPCKKWIVKRHK